MPFCFRSKSFPKLQFGTVRISAAEDRVIVVGQDVRLAAESVAAVLQAFLTWVLLQLAQDPLATVRAHMALMLLYDVVAAQHVHDTVLARQQKVFQVAAPMRTGSPPLRSRRHPHIGDAFVQARLG